VDAVATAAAVVADAAAIVAEIAATAVIAGKRPALAACLSQPKRS
jgi:hypothetical protein